MTNDCPLCHPSREDVLWRAPRWRVILAGDTDYPGFCRVIWNAHVREMTDLAAAERAELMDAVFAVEAALRETLGPEKINLASLGNQVPHLHWHVIARFAADRHFPDPVWAAPRRAGKPARLDRERLQRALTAQFQQGRGP
jgi:diadenosine tetraphosphate (Ap4A) HIT family hydrolase